MDQYNRLLDVFDNNATERDVSAVANRSSYLDNKSIKQMELIKQSEPILIHN